MVNVTEKHKMISYKCFEALRGTFTTEQSFHLILGVATIKWIESKNKYRQTNFSINKILDSYENSLYFLEGEIRNIEYEFHEFDGVLTSILGNISVYKDKSTDKKIKEVLYIIHGSDLNSTDEIRKFINSFTLIGAAQLGFNETPESINKIILGLIDFTSIRSIANYCSGISGTAIEIFNALKGIRENEQVAYYAEEINTNNYLISKLLMIINGIDRNEIINKDVLVYGNDDVRKFDFVITDMPQIVGLDRRLSENDPRFRYGIPSRSSAEWAFGQNALYHITELGKGVIIGTKGTLVRGNEVDIRKGIVNHDLIECVITLPVNLYEKSSIGTEMIIFNRNKPIERQHKILFIDASQYGYRINKNQHGIREDGIDRILKTYQIGIEESGFSKFVELDKLKEYEYRLNPIEYLSFDVLKDLLTESISLKEIAEISRGVQISKKDYEKLSTNPEYYYLNIKDIDEGKIYYEESSKITFKKRDWIGKYDIQAGDILLTSKGWAIKVAIVEEDFMPSFISGNLTRIRVDPQKYNPYVLFEFLQSNVGTRMYEGLHTGTTIKLLNNAQLQRFQIPIYDIEFMNEIGYEIRINKLEYERRIEEAHMIFNSKRDELVDKLGFNNK